MAYDIQSFASLGAVHELIDGIDADSPAKKDSQTILGKLAEAIADARRGPNDLSNRLKSAQALAGGRAASIQVRSLLEKQWG